MKDVVKEVQTEPIEKRSPRFADPPAPVAFIPPRPASRVTSAIPSTLNPPKPTAREESNVGSPDALTEGNEMSPQPPSPPPVSIASGFRKGSNSATVVGDGWASSAPETPVADQPLDVRKEEAEEEQELEPETHTPVTSSPASSFASTPTFAASQPVSKRVSVQVSGQVSLPKSQEQMQTQQQHLPSFFDQYSTATPTATMSAPVAHIRSRPSSSSTAASYVTQRTSLMSGWLDHNTAPQQPNSLAAPSSAMGGELSKVELEQNPN
eukprot:TRINITY_DN19699_c0_g1_i1.p1 TRINITY_DN19699_c0_g1~~TRINITY_DN19699_c0_g1_i1.p1  ORF type:complete len:266 (+),score=55.56 TRINITY_DN19699_c0_g1_i1:740-1537(+)